MLHAIGKILYFLIWVLVFKAGREETPQPPEGGAEQDQNNLELGGGSVFEK
jgi:hypothetical protein